MDADAKDYIERAIGTGLDYQGFMSAFVNADIVAMGSIPKTNHTNNVERCEIRTIWKY